VVGVLSSVPVGARPRESLPSSKLSSSPPGQKYLKVTYLRQAGDPRLTRAFCILSLRFTVRVSGDRGLCDTFSRSYQSPSVPGSNDPFWNASRSGRTRVIDEVLSRLTAETLKLSLLPHNQSLATTSR